MTNLNKTLEPGDNYYNYHTGITLPHDSLLKDPGKLASLSGPVRTYNLRDVEEATKNA